MDLGFPLMAKKILVFNGVGYNEGWVELDIPLFIKRFKVVRLGGISFH